MKLDYHAGILAVRNAYGRYRRELAKAEAHAAVRRLDAAEGLVESLPAAELARSAVQAAITELTLPLTGEIGDAWRGAVIAVLLSWGIPVSGELHRGLAEPAAVTAGGRA
jgi:hypothetical protein